MTRARGVPLPYLRAWRIRRAMGQADLAAGSGLSRMRISQLENKADLNATFASIKRLADALGISAEELVYTDPATVPYGAPEPLTPAGKAVAA